MILDCHMHSWRYPRHFNRDVMLANQPPRRRVWSEEQFAQMWELPVERYLEEMKGSEVGKALLLGLKAGSTLGIEVDNDYLAGLVRQRPELLAWACCVTPTEAGAAAEVERSVRELGAVAIGELGPVYGSFRVDDPNCFSVWEVARDLDVPLVIHAGPAQARWGHLKYGDLMAVDEIAIQFPDLTIVICHLGYHRYEEAAFLVAKHENVYADISWLPQLAGFDRRALSRYLPQVEYGYYHLIHPLLYSFTQTFGLTDKLLWGTDFPAGAPAKSIESLIGINAWLDQHSLPRIPRESLHRMLHENWQKVFARLSGSRG
ncbi:MAG: amidohydrolase family protein [Candidatus Methylomirabilia bacterium]